MGLALIAKGASNELVFMNSCKMKLSVIIGVTQMTVGLITFMKLLVLLL